MTATPASDRFTSITAFAGQTVLAYDFPLTSAAGLTVIRIRAGQAARLSFGIDYFFPDGLGGAGGGTTTLSAAALENDIYQLVGLLPEQRVSDFLETQAFMAAKFNGDLDILTLIAQEHRRDIDRGLKVPLGADPLPAGHFPLSDGVGGIRDGGSGADIADAQENAAIATDRAAAAIQAAANAALYDPTFRFKVVADLVAATRAAAGMGTVWQAGPHLYVEAAAGAVDHDLTTAGGVKLYVQPGGDGRYALSALGVVEGGDITAAINKFFSKTRDVGFPVSVVIDGWWTVNQAIRVPYNVRLYGSSLGMLRAASPFEGVTFDRADTGGTLTVNTVLWCAETPGSANVATIGDDYGARREGLHIDPTVTLDCRDIADYGLFVDNIQNSFMACRILSPLERGVFDFSNGWGNRHWETILDPRVGGIWLRIAANGVDLSGAQIFGNNRRPTGEHILIEGDNNGLHVKLGFLEKGTTAVTLKAGTGPVVITAIDMEDMSAEVVVVDGTGIPAGRPAGPVTLLGCYMATSSTTKAVVKAINAIVHVKGCRIRNTSGAPAAGVAAFEASDGAVIYDEGNLIDPAGIGLLYVNGVVTERQDSPTLTRIAVRDARAASAAMLNDSFHSDPYVRSQWMGRLLFESVISSGSTREVLGRYSLLAAIHREGATVGVAGGVADAYGPLSLRPPDDNTNSLGTAAYQWKTAYLVAAPVVSSDRRRKIVDAGGLPDALLDAWAEHVRYSIWRWKEGDDRQKHIGLIAQDIIAAFDAAGLDWREYGIIEVDGDGYLHVRKDDAQAIENAMLRRSVGLNA